jgi:hypothetical protein
VLALAACATPQPTAKVVVAQVPAQRPSAQPTQEPVAVDRFKQSYSQTVIDSKTPPKWMAQGAGCALGQMTAMDDGQATVVPAHLCVGVHSAAKVTNATCEQAEAKAWSGLAKIFGVKEGVSAQGQKITLGSQTLVIQGARIDTTWRGRFAKAPVCAVQIAWPVSEFNRLQMSWTERGNEAQAIYQKALNSNVSVGSRCQQLERSSELLKSIPGSRRLAGKVKSSTLLNDLVLQAIGSNCTSEKTVVMGLHCTMDDEDKSCEGRLRSGFVDALNQAGWKIVGSELSGSALVRVMRGDQTTLRQETAQQGARYMAIAQVNVEKLGQPRQIMFCRANLDFRLLDSRSGSAVKTFEHSIKSGGLNAKQCYKKSSMVLSKKVVTPLTEALKVSP